MRKLITSLFMIVAMMLPLMTQAQTHYNLVVGSNSTSNPYVPNYTYYDYSFSQNIIPANSIGLSGEIDTLWYYVSSGSATRTLTISMAEMSKSTFSGGTDVIPTSAFTQVFTGSVSWSSGWIAIPLDTPFDYQDTANLVIMVLDATGSYVTSPYYAGSTGSANVSLYQYQDNNPCSPENQGNSKSMNMFTPYMRIGISSYDVYCSPLNGISMSGITTSDAVVNINEAATATAWDVIVSDSVITDFESAYYTTTYTTDYNVSGLDANTKYYVYARANCGSAVSGWFGPIDFTTACEGTTAVPYSQDFEGLATGELPNCWMQFATGSSSACSNFPCAYAYSGNARNSQVYFEMESSSGETEIIALPEMDNISDLELDFYYGTNSSIRPTLEVGVMEDTTFVVVDTVDITASTSINNYVPARVLFGNYTGDGTRIAMRTTKSGSYTLFIEDLEVIVAPTCNTMPGNVSIVSIDSAECTIAWGAALNGSSYAIYEATTDQWYNTYDTTYTFTGLNPNTVYSGVLYHVCAAGDSSYSVSYSFRTDCGAMVLPFTETFEGQTSGTPSCWTVTSAAGSYPQVSTGDAYNGNAKLEMYSSSTDNVIASPKIYQALNTIETKFYAKKSSDYATIQLQVGYTTNLDSAAVILESIDLTDSYVEYTVSLANTNVTDNGYLVFKKPAGGYYSAHMDNITIREISDCATPQGVRLTGVGVDYVSIAIDDTVNSSWDIAVCNPGGNPDNLDSYEYSTTTDYTINNLEDTLTYDIYVRTNCGGTYSYWVGPVSARPNTLDIAANSHDTLTMCSGTLYDDGGMNGQYSNSQTTTFVILPTDPSSQGVMLTGTLRAEGSNYDYMKIYDGIGTEAPILFNSQGSSSSTIHNINVASTGHALTVYFRTDGSAVYDGFELHVSCFDMTCSAIDSLTVTNYDHESVTLDWVDGGNESGWYVQYSDTNFTFGSATGSTVYATSHPFTINGLNANTRYYFSVAAACGGDTSMARSINIKTNCFGNLVIPYTDGFEDYSTGEVPSCWTAVQTGTSSSGTFPSCYEHSPNTHSGNVYFEMESGNGQTEIAAMPPVDSLQYLELNFWMGTSSSYCTTFEVGVMEGTNFVVVDTIDFSMCTGITDYHQFTVYFSNYTGTGNQIAFRASKTSGQMTVFIDDLTLDYAPTCIPVTGLTCTGATTNTVDLAWTENGQASMWEIGEGTATTEPATGTVVSTNPYTVSGLTAGQTYFFYVRNICTAGDTGAWAGPVRVTTMATNPINLPLVLDFEDSADYVFNYVQLTGSNDWIIGDAANDDHSLYVTNDNGITNSYTNSSSSVSFAYVPVVVPFDSIYSISFDWHASGEGSYDKLRVALVPPTIDLTTASTSWSSYGSYSGNALPAGWIALDNGCMSGQSSWTNYNGTFDITAGTYNLVFVWTNDGSAGTNPAAAVDNIDFRILTCPAPSDVAATDATASSLTIDWNSNGSENMWQVMCDGVIATTTSHPYTISGLEPLTSYSIRVRPICSATDTGAWSSVISAQTSMCDNPVVAINYDAATEATTSSNSIANSFYNNSYSETIIMADDLAQMTGEITAFAFNPTNTTGGSNMRNCTVYLGHTTDSVFTDDYLYDSTFVAVYTGDLNFSTTGWQIFPFDAPFTYDGQSNLVLVIQREDGSYVSGQNFAAHNAGQDVYRTRYYYNDYNAMTPGSIAGGTNSSIVPDIQLISCGAGCGTPSSLAVTNVDYESATITWSGSAAEYEVAITEFSNINWPAAVTTSNTTYTFTGLYPNTTYAYRVRGNCDTLGTSAWREGSFTTDSLPCFVPTNVTTSNATVNGITVAWTMDAQSTAQAWVVNVFNATTNIMDTVSTNPATISGLYDNTQYSVAVQSMCSSIISSDWSDTVTFTTTTCSVVSNVQINNVTTSGATVTWTAGASETAWEVNYGRSGFGEGQGTIASVTSTTYQITGLEEDEDYDVYVRAKCAEGIYSDWSPVQTFITLKSDENGIDGVEGNYSLSIYPNPATSNTTISLRGIEGEVTITVVDMNGRTISSDVMSCGADCVKTMTVDGLAQGTYFVRVLGDGINSVRKLIVR